MTFTITRKVMIYALSTTVASAGAAAGGYQLYKDRELNKNIADLCANHVVTWAKTFGTDSVASPQSSLNALLRSVGGAGMMPQQMSFGPNQEKFVKELNAYIRAYIDTGKDQVAEQGAEWVQQYTPGYIGACRAYYKAEFSKCGKLEKEANVECLKQADQTYNEVIQASILEATLVNKKPWDLASTNLESMMRAHRRLQAGELVTSAIATSLEQAEPKAEAANQESWGKFVASTGQLKEAIAQQPTFLQTMSAEDLATLTNAVNEVAESLPPELVDVKPQVVNFRDSIKAKRGDLVTQYCDYFQKYAAAKRTSASTQ